MLITGHLLRGRESIFRCKLDETGFMGLGGHKVYDFNTLFNFNTVTWLYTQPSFGGALKGPPTNEGTMFLSGKKETY